MPIRPELRKFYGPEWIASRDETLQRVNNRCQQCHKPNGRIIYTRTGNGRMFWRIANGSDFHDPGMFKGVRWRNETGWPLSIEDFRIAIELPVRRITVVLTRAHLNHTPGDDRPENIRVLCQWCHLHFDKLHHKDSRSRRKDQARPLLQQVSA